MRFFAPHVSASVSGDYYQLYLGPDESDEEAVVPEDVAGPYLLVSQQFEFHQEHCYIESDNENYLGEFPLRLVEFSPVLLAFDIGRSKDTRVEISFLLSPAEYEHARRVLEVILGLREPSEDDDAL